MTTAAELIKFLQTFPAETLIECGTEVCGIYDSYMSMQSVDISLSQVIAYTGESDKKYTNMYGKTILQLHSDS